MEQSPFSAGGSVAEMKWTIAYYPNIADLSAAEAFAKKHNDRYILFGERGLSPFLMKFDGNSLFPLIEIALSNKNRELFSNTILSAPKAGFSGAVITTGSFKRNENMPMPVFDLDVTQALRIAIELKKNGLLPHDFRIGVRAASGSEPAELRARHFIELGADFIVLSNANMISGIEARTMICEEPAVQ
jgi:hypothetical protein